MVSLVPVRNGHRRIFDSMFRDLDSFFDTPVRAAPAAKYRLSEKDGGYELQMVLPGFTSDEVKLSYEDNVLTVTAEKCEKDANTVLYANAISQSYTIPEIDIDGAAAKLRDGILTVSLPKTEKAKPRQISVTSG